MDKTVSLRLEIVLPPQKMVEMIKLHHQGLEEEIQAGLQEALQGFDLKAMVKASAETAMQDAINSSLNTYEFKRQLTVAMEKFMWQEVQQFLATKKVEMQSLIDAIKVSVEKKDE